MPSSAWMRPTERANQSGRRSVVRGTTQKPLVVLDAHSRDAEVLFADLAPHDPFGEAHDLHVGNQNGFRRITGSNRCCVRCCVPREVSNYLVAVCFLAPVFPYAAQRARVGEVAGSELISATPTYTCRERYPRRAKPRSKLWTKRESRSVRRQLSGQGYLVRISPSQTKKGRAMRLALAVSASSVLLSLPNRAGRHDQRLDRARARATRPPCPVSAEFHS